jgi:allantoinase
MSKIYDTTKPYPRDLHGYGSQGFDPRWPNGARVALQFVLNFEEGGENSVLHGDAASETFLSEMANPEAFPARHLSMESIYEYGSRVGFWRISREFEERGLPLTIFAVSSALERAPEVCQAILEANHEIVCHGLKWISYQKVDEATERAHIAQATALIQSLTGVHPEGWYTGRDSPNTRRLLAEHGGYSYDSDYYGDDLPFWMKLKLSNGRDHHQLVVPYTLDCNDMRFSLPQGFSHADPFFEYLRASFDTLYAEGATQPRMMSVGMHCRLLGRPGRIGALKRFLDYVAQHEAVWICQRREIAAHWREQFPWETQA